MHLSDFITFCPPKFVFAPNIFDKSTPVIFRIFCPQRVRWYEENYDDRSNDRNSPLSLNPKGSRRHEVLVTLLKLALTWSGWRTALHEQPAPFTDNVLFSQLTSTREVGQMLRNICRGFKLPAPTHLTILALITPSWNTEHILWFWFKTGFMWLLSKGVCLD